MLRTVFNGKTATGSVTVGASTFYIGDPNKLKTAKMALP